MKKQILLSALVAILFTCSVQAQNATEAKAPNALTKQAMLKLASAGIPNAIAAKTYPVFFEYYAGKQQAEAAIINGQSNLSMAEVKARYVKNRDEALEKLFTAAQMKLFKTSLEAQLANAE